MDEFAQANLDWWNEAATIHLQGEGYDLASFKAGMIRLHPLELEEVGDVAGKKIHVGGGHCDHTSRTIHSLEELHDFQHELAHRESYSDWMFLAYFELDNTGNQL